MQARLDLDVRSSRGGVLESTGGVKRFRSAALFCEQGKVMDLIDGGGEGGELARWVFNKHFLNYSICSCFNLSTISQMEKIQCYSISFQNAKRPNSGSESDLVIRRCKYKLRSIKKGEGEDDGVGGPRKRGPKPRLRSAGMSR